MHEGSQNMKDYMKIYQEWLANPYFDDKTKEDFTAAAMAASAVTILLL